MDTAPLRTARSTYDIYREHLNTVYRVAFTYMKNPFDAEDAAQETFARLIRSGQRFRTPEKEKAWLIVTVSNICKDMLRRRKKVRFVSYEEQTLTVQPPEVPMPVDEAIERLQPEYRVLITLYYLGGFDMKDLASMFSVPVTTIKSRLTRAKKHLSLLLKQDEEEKAL